MNNLIPSPTVRAWIYSVLVAASALAAGYGLITADQGNLWLTLAAAILGLSNTLALTNTPTEKHSTRSSSEDSGA